MLFYELVLTIVNYICHDLFIGFIYVNRSTPENSSLDPIQQRYRHEELEPHWQKIWEKDHLYKTETPNSSDNKFYALSMFPYPSGSLHMGHVRNYVITDVIARFKRMNGYSVLHPMGWDAFGLPAENAAIERGINPETWTKQNIEQMKSQLKRLGLSIDWDREIATCDPSYYKWTQYIFLQLYNQGLAYQKNAKVNWDPIDKTVLANEQVDSEGRSWRSGALVEQKDLRQWFLGITKFGDQLINDIEKLKGWPERVKMMQSNWIGKSNGTKISFDVNYNSPNTIDIFTTRPDTIYGVTYLVISPNHKIVNDLIRENKIDGLSKLKNEFNNLTQIERSSESRNKNGIDLGINVTNPINGEKIPLWTADYVIDDYGTGAVMGVPAHDIRDFEFARKFSLNIRYVISPEKNENPINNNSAYTGDGYLINSAQFNGLKVNAAKKEITQHGSNKGWAEQIDKYKLRDWLISRQRYWGCPIPIIHCPNCGQVPVPEEQLPVKLPNNISFSGKGKSPLAENNQWINVKCPKCTINAKRETDTMDTFICSSWYFLRYTDPLNSKQPFDRNLINKWLPVDQYVGGIEHAILHLLYSRFLTKALNSSNLIDINEPFKNLLTQGMVQSITYKNPNTLKYIPVEKIRDINTPKDPYSNEPLEVIYEKMSKSKYNGIDPTIVINKYGADTARMFILFKAPPEKDLEWEDSDVEGQHRFLQRIYKVVHEYVSLNSSYFKQSSINNKAIPKNLRKFTAEDEELKRAVHLAIKKTTEDLNEFKFNTAISELMILTNKINDLISKASIDIAYESITILIKLLAPFSPHLSEELWKIINSNESIHIQTWPVYDSQAIITNTYELVIQINGKVRGKLNVNKALKKSDLENLALKSEISNKWTNGITPKRVIVVEGKLVNIVI